MAADREKYEYDLSASGMRAWITDAHEKEKQAYSKGSSAVLIPILIRGDGYRVLYEVRATMLHSQPGEICFPGGRIEPGESPMETAVREAAEELCIRKEQIEIVGEVDCASGPGGVPLYSYVGILHGYEGTWSEDEVDHVFTIPLEWILTHDPAVYKVKMVHSIPEDFPFDKIPGGRGYRWRSGSHDIPFYPELPGEETLLWGATARVTQAFAKLLRSTGQAGKGSAGGKKT